MEYRNAESLRPHPLNKEIYLEFRAEAPANRDLIESIKDKGILQPLVVRPSGLIISGHRRFDAGQVAGIVDFPCDVKESGDDVDLIQRPLVFVFAPYHQDSCSSFITAPFIVSGATRLGLSEEPHDGHPFRETGAPTIIPLILTGRRSAGLSVIAPQGLHR